MKTVLSRVLPCWYGAALFAAATLSPVAIIAADEAAPEDAATVIARARAYLGGDAALDAVKSLHFVGTITDQDGKSHQIDMIARQPMQQLITETTATLRVVTGLDNYAGWRKEGPLDRPDVGRISLMNANEIRLLRARTWQVLSYYQDIESVGGSVRVTGEEEVDGVTCVRTVFAHSNGVEFVRFFDKATGRLVLTRTHDGAELRESGEIMVDGVRFPKELMQTYEGKSSKVVFDSVTVNEEFPDSLFSIPTPKINFGPPDTSSSAPVPEPAPTPVASPSEPAAPPPPAKPAEPSAPELVPAPTGP